MSRFKVVVTSRSFGSISDKAPRILEGAGCEIVRVPGPLAPEDLATALADADGAIVGVDLVNANVLASAPKLKVVSKHGAGVDNIDVAAATERGIAVTNVPAANSDAVADLTIGMMLAIARKVPQADKSVRAGEWKRFYGSGVWGKTMGIIGFGAIGRAVARRARGFNMRILAYDVMPSQEAAKEIGVELADLDTILREADYVSIHVPLTPGTRNLIDARRLGTMKESAYLINMARGGVVSEADLAQALKDKIIAGAAVDVYEEEPPAEDHPFFGLDNVVVTPHMAAYTDDAIDNMSIGSAQNTVDVLTGAPCKFVVNAKDLEARRA